MTGQFDQPPTRLESAAETSFAELWQAGGGLSPREKLRLVEKLATLIRESHERRRVLGPPGLGGVLVSGGAGDFRLRIPASRAIRLAWRDWRRRDLARLYASLLPRLSRSCGFRFLRHYLGGGGGLRDCVALALQVDGAARRMAAARWKQAERACLRSGQGFVTGRSGRLQYYRRDSDEAQALLERLVADPDGLIGSGERLPGRGNSCLTVKIEAAGRNYVLKRYNRRGWAYSLRHVFRRSRALRGWITSWGFRARGAAIPDPILCVEERCFRFLGHSYILSEYLEGTKTLTRLWESLSAGGKKSCLVQLAVLFGRLHRLGAIHGDTNWDNILAAPRGAGYDLFLVDMDCSRVYGRVREAKVRKDIKHVFRDLHRLSPGDHELDRGFRACWERWSGVRSEI
ncbi:hypothetical protein DESUT3_22610 [Desulfuromonas versatilis]|uniref:Protein kinase domain-containing protein n=1 Tax=Desulfuromonas versatilis TaxID=2802975 RepID=A0ABN6DYJ6_9BACT|nr:lipopolysaccharide kinase InaA family protein [Desulfuromonas versatilis]BCR05192.1 hypothetical protein DESUT3_22610 [Desulfuromonas versatilis]